MTDYKIYFYAKDYTVVEIVYKDTKIIYDFYTDIHKSVLNSYAVGRGDFGKVYGYCVKYGKQRPEADCEEATQAEKEKGIQDILNILGEDE